MQRLSLLLIVTCLILASANAQSKKGDRDGDGVPDKEDKCPDKPGRANRYMNGCPDRDGDYVLDDDDRCPDIVGLGYDKGCPNSDQDSLVDIDDDCPQSSGPVANKGCPEKSTNVVPVQQPSTTTYAATPPANWKLLVDSLRNVFYTAFDKASTDAEQATAVRNFGDKVRYGLKIETLGGLEYAIEPVMRTRGAGNPALARLIADTYNKTTGYFYSAMMAMVPADGAKEKAKSKPASSTRAPNEMFYATENDYANVDWDALGRRKAEPGYTTGQHIAFLEEVSKDVRKYLDATFTKNGNTYKRYRRSREVDGNHRIYGGQEVPLSGKTTPILILSYCQNFGSNAKAKVTIDYDGNGKKTDNKTVLTGASCNVITDCGNRICKTTCSGAIEVDRAYSTHALWLERQGTWNGLEKVYWVVLVDQQQ